MEEAITETTADEVAEGEGGQGSYDRARIRYGGRSGSARGQGHHRDFCGQRA